MGRFIVLRPLLLLPGTMALAIGCTSDGIGEVASTPPQAIEHGFPAVDDAFDLVGAIWREPPPIIGRSPVRPEAYLCHGTLIGEQMVLTSRSCASRVQSYLDGAMSPLAFRTGPDYFHPTRSVRIVATKLAPNIKAFDGVTVGANLGVVYLGEPITHLRPARIAALDDELIGASFAIVGYSAPNEREVGEVRIGKRLPTNDEVLVDDVAGDAYPCGDEGVPLLRHDGDGLAIHGVFSRSVGEEGCGSGWVYTALSPTTLRFLRDASAFRDPCRGVPTYGLCEGSVERRCVASPLGPLHYAFDCAWLGLVCVEGFTVGCFEPR